MDWDWEQIKELIKMLMEICAEDGASKDELKQKIVRPTRGDWWAVRRHMRHQLGIFGRALNGLMRDLKAEHVAEGPRGCKGLADELLEDL